ncbi:MAG: hypothetical protein ACTSWX_01145 [Promethearchaeota archaeon]
MPTQAEILRIRDKIKKIQEGNQKFLRDLEKLEVLPRSKLIQLNYQDKVEKQALWLKKSIENIKNSIDNEDYSHNFDEKSTELQKSLKNLLEQIKTSPKKKKQYIKQFLERYCAIEKADREIILTNFEEYSREKLEEELKDIVEIFGKK